MKFNQFLELESKLKKNGRSVNDLVEHLEKDKDPDQLFEIFGINKALLSWGASKVHMNQMKKKAEKVKEFLLDRTGQYLQKIMNTQKKLTAQIARIKNANKPVPKKMIEALMNIEQRIIKIVDQSTDKLISLKTKEINQAIEDSKKLKPKTKIAMEYFWEEMMSDLKVEIVANLFKEKVLNLDKSVTWHKTLEKKQNDIKKEARAKLKIKASELSDEKSEGGKEKSNQGEELPTK